MIVLTLILSIAIAHADPAPNPSDPPQKSGEVVQPAPPLGPPVDYGTPTVTTTVPTVVQQTQTVTPAVNSDPVVIQPIVPAPLLVVPDASLELQKALMPVTPVKKKKSKDQIPYANGMAPPVAPVKKVAIGPKTTIQKVLDCAHAFDHAVQMPNSSRGPQASFMDPYGQLVLPVGTGPNRVLYVYRDHEVLRYSVDRTDYYRVLNGVVNVKGKYLDKIDEHGNTKDKKLLKEVEKINERAPYEVMVPKPDNGSGETQIKFEGDFWSTKTAKFLPDGGINVGNSAHSAEYIKTTSEPIGARFEDAAQAMGVRVNLAFEQFESRVSKDVSTNSTRRAIFNIAIDTCETVAQCSDPKHADPAVCFYIGSLQNKMKKLDPNIFGIYVPPYDPSTDQNQGRGRNPSQKPTHSNFSNSVYY